MKAVNQVEPLPLSAHIQTLVQVVLAQFPSIGLGYAVWLNGQGVRAC